MADQRERIGHHLLMLNRSGQQAPIRLMLDQSRADSVSRHFRYYQYLLKARQQEIAEHLAAARRLRELEQSLRQSLVELQALQAEAQQQQVNLLAMKEARQQTLVSLDKDLASKSASLKQLERDRVALQKIIDQIEKQRALALAIEQERLAKAQKEAEQAQKAAQAAALSGIETDRPVNAGPTPTPTPQSPVAVSPLYTAGDLDKLKDLDFSKKKGKLPWPAKGKVGHRYGEPRQGSLSWEGIDISSTAGADVRAVHYGRVVYAEWLRGQGMLMILDHGNGYMTLYAHNDVLLRTQGEWVQAGDVIARVGNSGGGHTPGLYFEVRHNGKTMNPQQWLGGR